jgi:hypothetical protein
MYSSDYLKSEDAVEIYRLIGHSAEIKFKYIENNIKNKKKNFKLIIDEIVFDVENETLHYSQTIERKNNEFLNIDVCKKLGEDLINIKLTNGIIFKEIKSSNKIEKACVSVSYTYNKGIVNVEKVESQNDDKPLTKSKKKN